MQRRKTYHGNTGTFSAERLGLNILDLQTFVQAILFSLKATGAPENEDQVDLIGYNVLRPYLATFLRILNQRSCHLSADGTTSVSTVRLEGSLFESHSLDCKTRPFVSLLGRSHSGSSMAAALCVPKKRRCTKVLVQAEFYLQMSRNEAAFPECL